MPWRCPEFSFLELSSVESDDQTHGSARPATRPSLRSIQPRCLRRIAPPIRDFVQSTTAFSLCFSNEQAPGSPHELSGAKFGFNDLGQQPLQAKQAKQRQ